jgi:predicted extracellular nuclease
MTSLFDSIQSPGRKTVLAALLAGLCAAAPAFAVPANVVISQVYGAGGNSGSTYARDFIELFNRSDVPVSLSGMSVQYQSASGPAWAGFTVLGNVTLQPGQYFLVAESNAVAGDGDVIGNLSLSGTTGKVALANQTTLLNSTTGGDAVLDLVGFGTANRYEGDSAAPAPSPTTSISRLSGGCIDTDQNGRDFVAGPIAPRRSTSPLNACGATIPATQPIVLTCPASVSSQSGTANSAILRASDADSIVNGAAITSVTTATGITLSGFTPATVDGGSASVRLDVASNLPAGSYSVTVNFTNNNNQAASCVIPVSVTGGVLTIPQIQGSGATSPYNNTVQTTSGVITGKISTGFFIQDPNGDGDPTTSDGLFIYTTGASGNIGDAVTVTGTITEYTAAGATRTYTEMTNVSGLRVTATGRNVTPTNIAFPIDDLARYEGMLVRFTTPLTVNGNYYLGNRGELILSNGRREVPTNRFRPGTPEAIALQQANDKNFIVLDDGIFTTPATIPYLAADGTVRSGDTINDLTGVLDFGPMGGGGAVFKLQPTVTPVISRTNPRLEAPVLASGNVKVASANVLNFFTTFTNGGDAWGRTGQGCVVGNSAPARGACRGAANLAEFVRQRDKIVNQLKAMDADAVGLMEIQNNDDIATAYLVDQLNLAIGSTTYAVVPKPPATGTDAIRVAMIYKPSTLTLVGGALSDGDAINNRAPIAATFKAANGGKFSLVVNHLKSKSSDGCPSSGADADKKDGQGCFNGLRLQQATRLATYFVPQVVATSGDPDVIIVGDLNAHAFEDPIALLTSSGLVNEIERFVRPRTQPYSYSFDAEAGYLDHALATAALDGQVVDVTEWHNNADEPVAIDYNLGDTPVDYYTNDAFRASDHDPVVVSLNLASSSTDVTQSVKIVQLGYAPNRITGKYSGVVTFTNTSGTALAGPLHFILEGLDRRIVLDNRSGIQNGSQYITLPAGLAAGATVSVTIILVNPSKTSVVYQPKLISGTF